VKEGFRYGEYCAVGRFACSFEMLAFAFYPQRLKSVFLLFTYFDDLLMFFIGSFVFHLLVVNIKYYSINIKMIKYVLETRTNIEWNAIPGAMVSPA